MRPPAGSAVEPAAMAGSSLFHSALLTLGDLTDDARVAGQHVLRVRVHIVRRCHELAAVIAAAHTQKGKCAQRHTIIKALANSNFSLQPICHLCLFSGDGYNLNTVFGPQGNQRGTQRLSLIESFRALS